MKRRKKALAGFLSLLIVLCSFPVPSFADESLFSFAVIGERTGSNVALAEIDGCSVNNVKQMSAPEEYGEDFYADASAYEITVSDIDVNGTLHLSFSFDEGERFNHSVWGIFPKISTVGYTFDDMIPMNDEDDPDDPGIVIPIDDDPVIPIDDDPVIPIDDDPIIPIDDDPVIPIDDDPVIPIDDDPVIPIDDDPIIPIDDDPIIPIDDDPVIPIDDPTDPSDDIIENCIDDNIVQQICDTSTYEWDVTLENGRAQIVLYRYKSVDSFVDYIDGELITVDEGKAPWTRSWSQTTGVPMILNFRLVDDQPLVDVKPMIGQLDIVRDLFEGNKTTYLAVPYGVTETQATITVSDMNYSVVVNDSSMLSPDIDGIVIATLKTSLTEDGIVGGYSNTISIYDGDILLDTYTIIGVSQRYKGLPDKVLDFLCIGSQYTNIRNDAEYGLRAVRSLIGSNFDAGGVLTGPVSLGNFGGYIIYYYKNAIQDNPNNPYGIDFITFGNSVEGSDEFAEPGQVWVSEDGESWYALAGGMHYEDYADWDYSVTYTRTGDGHTRLVDSNGKSSEQRFYEYPDKTLYTLHTFSKDDETDMVLNGIGFIPSDDSNQYGNIRPPFSGFGYTDMGQKGLASADNNKAGNPYLGTTWLSTGREISSVTDGMDLAWAVDANGQPVKLENGVHYIKIVTASNINNGAIGEKSTEVNMVRVARANETPVGISTAPESISFDGNTIGLKTGTKISSNVYAFNDVKVSGPFIVDVDAENSNVYINNTAKSSVVYDKIPDHKIIRVIVQEGEKEPLIYVFNLVEDEEEPSAVLTLDANGGKVNGNDTYAMTFDAGMAGYELPEPTNTDASVEFDGWYYGQRLYTEIPSDVRDITLTAKWESAKSDDPSGNTDDTIRVSFRLIGSTIATEDVDLSKGEEGYYTAEYQNWIKTRTYTMHSDDSVYDLFVKATGDAGIESKGANKGYVSSIKAPDSLGGYWLSEFTNGKYSGWMYTMDGKHTNAIKDQKLKDGADVVFHYVNDYRYEVEDWFDEPAYPAAATDGEFYNRWLEAADVRPGSQGGTTPVDPAAEQPVETPENPGGAADRFIDVEANDWFAGSVDYAVEKGFMTGTGADTFSPDKELTRGMLVSMLYSLEGVPAEDGKTAFGDVKTADWFAKGVDWAVENGVAAGYGENFGPNDDITREQMVVMLYGYAKLKGYTLAEGADLSAYKDVDEISAWALEAVRWAKGANLITGRSADLLAPKGTTTRAEAATILRNFLENVAK